MPGIDEAIAIGKIGLPILASVFGSYRKNKANTNSADEYAREANRTAKINQQIAGDNLAWQRDRFNQSMDWARQIRGEDQLGYGDALQNQTYFDDQLGWQTLLSPRGQQIVDASTRQDILNRTELDRNNRERENRDAQFQRGEQLTASQNKNAYDNIYRQDETALSDQIYASGQQGRNDFLDQLAARDNMISARTRGVADFSRGQSDRARQGADDVQTAKINALLKGKTLSRDIFNNDQNNASKQYFDFRNRSVQPWESSFMPTNVGNFAPGNANAGNQMLSSALNSPVPQLDYIQPNFANANSVYANGQADVGNLDTLAGLAGGLYSIYRNNQNTQRQVGGDLDALFKRNPSTDDTNLF